MAKQRQNLHNNQYGLVSFFVVVIIMIVLSLIVLAFAQLVRREQRQSLDRQLSTQAFYAAESGVNDAINVLPDLIASGASWGEGCNSFIEAANNLPGVDINPDLGGGIAYSCLLVDPAPSELSYDSVDIDESQTVPIQAGDGGAISVVEVSWEDPTGNTTVSGCPNPADANTLPGSLPSGCEVGALRLEMIPFPIGGSRTRDQLISDRFIAFAQPRSGGITSAPFASGGGDNQGLRQVAGCNTTSGAPRYCTVRITGLSSNRFYLRMRSVYRPTSVTVRAFRDAAATSRVDLVGAQVEIDATGRASDVLRRIKVSRPLESSVIPSPEFAVQSAGTLCKRFSIAPAPPGGTHLLEFDPSNLPECNPTN